MQLHYKKKPNSQRGKNKQPVIKKTKQNNKTKPARGIFSEGCFYYSKVFLLSS